MIMWLVASVLLLVLYAACLVLLGWSIWIILERDRLVPGSAQPGRFLTGQRPNEHVSSDFPRERYHSVLDGWKEADNRSQEG